MTYRELQKLYYEKTGKTVSLTVISRRVNQLRRLPTIEELKPRRPGRPINYKKK